MDENIVGQITKAYTTAKPEYFRIFISAQDIIIVSYGAFTGHSIEAIAIQMYKARKTKQKVDQLLTRQDIFQNFPNALVLSRNDLQQIRLKKQLTDALIEFELPPSKGFLGKKRNIKKYGFPKNEYEDVKGIFSIYYNNILSVK
ncbi:MAG: hypothetical protein JSW11_14625 [Candidatus Heimdallarchaeota archaeon]|nr:MAG: hypothetical protein JSW11_14625 [Candidatus Heimdallarchaeota archaeon]